MPVTAPQRQRPTVLALLGVALLSAAVSSASTVGLISAIGVPAAEQAGAAPATEEPAAELAIDSGLPADLTDVVERATQSVVTVTAVGVSRAPFSPFGRPTRGVGSGVIVSSTGLIVTNNHVVEGARDLTVTTADGEELNATLVSTDPQRDLATIRAEGGPLVPATLGDSVALEVGETVFAIGSPLGEFTETVTRGIVSALDRSIDVADEQSGRGQRLTGLVQTDAAINPGNSGGPLINERGEVIAINTAVAGSAQGIGFAVPINAAKQLIDEASRSIA